MSESIFAALLAGRPEVQRLLPGRFAEPAAWCQAAREASGRRIEASVLDELARQSSALPPSDARQRNLEKLARAGTTVVVTGQQVGLFGGPLYTLHKAATAIARARMIEASTGLACVPLFWLQTEDHDYAEIARVTITTPSGAPATFALPEESSAETRVSLAQRVLPREIAALVDECNAALDAWPYAREVAALLQAHYVPGRAIGAAFAGVLAELWQDEGLLLLDPRVPSLARLAAPCMARALEQSAAIADELAARADAIAAAGCDLQVRTRDDAALVFFHERDASGPRYRLVRAGDGWKTAAGESSQAALTALLSSDPLRFSSSALLRPLLQDSWLPSCAYVGGPAELSYFAQLPPLYARFSVPMPLIAPRARLRILDGTTRSLLSRVGLEAVDFDRPRDALLARVATRSADEPNAEQLRTRMLASLEHELDALAGRELDGLANPIRKAREACNTAIDKLVDKAERALLERDRVASERIDRLIAALRPNGVPQERAYGFLGYAARVGPRALSAALLEAATPLDPNVRDVCL